jgi:thiol-disulfide isomerase/thioredoxin
VNAPNPSRFILALVFSSALCACREGEDQKKPFVTKARSQAIEAEAAAAPAEPAAPKPSAKGQTPEKPHRVLCDGQLDRPGRELSKDKLERTKTASGKELPEDIPVGKGRWTWLNFWAAWCVPCREEIPRLRSWEKKLNAGKDRFRLVFVSLDDDERQLESFLDKQPSEGLTTTYWIKEGDAREEWFSALDMDPDPQLPAHILVDPKGSVRCIVDGAVEDSEYPAVSEIISG